MMQASEAKSKVDTHHVPLGKMIHTKRFIEWNREDEGIYRPKKDATVKVYTMDTNYTLTNNSNLKMTNMNLLA
jgi:hypothetical protein